MGRPAHNASEAAAARQNHRKSDAERRQKEVAALRLLDELTSCARSDHVGKEQSTREKLVVLQEGAAEIERLRAVVQQLTEAVDQSNDKIGVIKAQLQAITAQCTSHGAPLVPATASLLRELGAHHALYASCFIHGQLALWVLDLESGLIVDVNAAFLAMTGWSRSEIVRTSIALPRRVLVQLRHGDHWAASRAWEASRRPPVRRRPGTETAGKEQVEWVSSPPVAQYPASVRLVKELSEGSRKSFQCTWRCL